MTRIWNLTKTNWQSFFIIRTTFCKRVTRGVAEGGFACPFAEIGKKWPNFEKNPFRVICMLNFLLKIQFLRVCRRKN